MKCNAKQYLKALTEIKNEKIKAADVEIMIPLVSTDSELKNFTRTCRQNCKKKYSRNTKIS